MFWDPSSTYRRTCGRRILTMYKIDHVAAVGFLLCVISLPSLGAECTIKKSGNKCTASCSVGTLSLTCGEEACSSSCSDSKGNKTAYLAHVYRDFLASSNGRVNQRDISEMLMELRRSRFQIHSREVRARGYSFSVAGLDTEALESLSSSTFDQVLRELDRQTALDLLDPRRFQRLLESLPRY